MILLCRNCVTGACLMLLVLDSETLVKSSWHRQYGSGKYLLEGKWRFVIKTRYKALIKKLVVSLFIKNTRHMDEVYDNVVWISEKISMIY